ncbi:MAG TPA: hypothetical protein VFR36_01395 [Sphingomicrobium sp.]|nr:hypothetical protein [Sphingomicrobium sp.]
MKNMMWRAALISGVALVAGPAVAEHPWNNYHWKKGSGELTVPVGDNVSAQWDDYLQRAMNGGPRVSGGTGEGWNASSVINSAIVAGSTNPRTCKARAGTIQVCNSRYGNNGWLGIAQIWLSGGHIVQGVTKLNDTYFDTNTYNKPEWRMLVTCQEIGHDYGLGHTDETFNNANDGTCMDYTSAPAGGVVGGFNYGPSNEYINQHDKDQLANIYNHSEPTQTNFAIREFGKAPVQDGFSDNDIGGDGPPAWGSPISRDSMGRPDVFVADLGNGKKRVTHVFWAMGEGPRGGHHE